MERLGPRELEGMTAVKRLARPGARTRLLRIGGYLLLPGLFLASWGYTMLTRRADLADLMWLGPCMALGFVAIMASRYTEEFCRTCDRQVDKKRHREMRDGEEFSGYVVLCRRCRTYQAFMTSPD